jgi:hypothetical protein
MQKILKLPTLLHQDEGRRLMTGKKDGVVGKVTSRSFVTFKKSVTRLA